MTDEIKKTYLRGFEGSVNTGGWFLVISTFLDFLRDIVPETFPESGITFLGSILALIAGGFTSGVVHNSQLKKSKNKYKR